MSWVSNSVIHLANSRGVTKETLTEHGFRGSNRTSLQYFEAIDTDDAGGSKFFECDLLVAAFNYVSPADIADWFMALPWEDHDEAVLSISGNNEGIVCIVGENKQRVRQQWFT